MCIVKWCLGRGSIRKFHGMFSIKGRQQQPENGQMKTCWSTPQSSNNKLPTLFRKKNNCVYLCIKMTVYVYCLCVIGREEAKGNAYFAIWVMEKYALWLVSVYNSNTTSVQCVFNVSVSTLSLYCYHLVILCHSVWGETLMCSLGLTQH